MLQLCSQGHLWMVKEPTPLSFQAPRSQVPRFPLTLVSRVMQVIQGMLFTFIVIPDYLLLRMSRHR